MSFLETIKFFGMHVDYNKIQMNLRVNFSITRNSPDSLDIASIQPKEIRSQLQRIKLSLGNNF